VSEFVGIIETIEDDDYQGKAFKKVTLGDGYVLKVKYGREGYLKDKWGELQVGRAYSWTMGEYKGKPFVEDFKQVDIFTQDMSHEVEPEAMPDISKPPKDGKMTKEDWANKDLTTRSSIEKQVALKCACEMCGCSQIKPTEVLSYANAFTGWLTGAIAVKDDDVFRLAISHANFKKEEM